MMTKTEKSKIKELCKSKAGIKLDLGCGENKQPGFVGLDKRGLAGVDIVHDIEQFPLPLPNECCLQILASHLVEHIKPWLMIDLFDELWRISKIGGQLLVSMPYGVSRGFQQDPTHCNACNETTWEYFDPRKPLYCIYKPKPWKVIRNDFYQTGNMEVILEKIPDDPKYKKLRLDGWNNAQK